jgi:hypothetical protein
MKIKWTQQALEGFINIQSTHTLSIPDKKSKLGKDYIIR